MMDYDCKVCGNKFIAQHYLDEHICRVGTNIPPRKFPTITDIGPAARVIAGCESCAALRAEVERLREDLEICKDERNALSDAVMQKNEANSRIRAAVEWALKHWDSVYHPVLRDELRRRAGEG